MAFLSLPDGTRAHVLSETEEYYVVCYAGDEDAQNEHWKVFKHGIPLHEFVNQAYDTLAGNVGMSPYHVAFDPSRLGQCECDAANGRMTFQLMTAGGILTVQLQATVIPNDYFPTEKEG